MSLHTSADGSRRVPRRLLALALLLALAALAGCSSPGSVDLTAVDDEALAAEASHPVPPEGEERRIVREAVANGSTTATGAYPPVRGDERPFPFRDGGRYYRLSSTVVDEETVYGVDVQIDYNATDLAGAEPVRVADLPPADRRAVESLLPPEVDRRVEGYEVGTSTTYTESALANSTLVDRAEPREYVVAHDGERYRVRVEPPSPFTRHTYRYTAEEVAGSDAAYADRLRERHLFVLRGLSDAEREVLTEARNGTYHADGEDDAAFEAVVERFRSHDALRRDEYGGDWIVRWRGRTYWVDLRVGAYAER